MLSTRIPAVVAGTLIALVIVVPSALANDHGIRLATSGDHSELVDRLPIERGRPSKPHVVMSIPVRKVGGVDRGDELALTAELQLTTDCDSRSPRCLGDPYHYNPRVTTSAVLAPSPSSVGGPGTTWLAGAKPQLCRQAKPNREHHCVLVRESPPRHIGAGDCTKACYVNLLAAAGSPRAHLGEYLAVGGLRPNGTVPQDRGRLNLIRFSPPGEPKHRTAVTSRPVTRRLPLDQKRSSVLARRLAGLGRGDQIVVEARAAVDISALPYNVVLSSQLIVTDRKGDLVKGRGASFVSSRGELDEGNGFNCTQNKGRCTINKVGVLTIDRPPRTRSGRPMPLFISLVTRAGPKHQKAASGDRVAVAGGRMQVDRYPGRARIH